MTDEELENKAVSKVKEHLFFDYTEYEENAFEIGYVAGAKENSIVWHDLRKNPDGLPKLEGDYLVALKPHNTVRALSFSMFGGWKSWQNGDCMDLTEYVVAWCEMPKFEEETDE